MAVEANTGSTYTLYTGLVKANIVVFNPTKDGLVALGRNVDKEQEYKTALSEKEYSKLVPYIRGSASYIDKNGDRQNYSGLEKIEFLTSMREDIASTGSKKIINAFGNNSYSKDIETLQANPKMSWFGNEGIRYAYEGEGFTIDMIKAWLKVGRGNKCSIDNWAKIVNNDVSELKQYVENFKQMSITALYYVQESIKDGKTNYYQKVYNRFFTNGDDTSTAQWVKHFENGQSKINYQNSFDFQIFNPKADSPTDMADNKPTANEVF